MCDRVPRGPAQPESCSGARRTARPVLASTSVPRTPMVPGSQIRTRSDCFARRWGGAALAAGGSAASRVARGIPTVRAASVTQRARTRIRNVCRRRPGGVGPRGAGRRTAQLDRVSSDSAFRYTSLVRHVEGGIAGQIIAMQCLSNLKPTDDSYRGHTGLAMPAARSRVRRRSASIDAASNSTFRYMSLVEPFSPVERDHRGGVILSQILKAEDAVLHRAGQ